MLKVMHVVGARPNFMKVAPLIQALKTYSKVDQLLVHTGQHYDINMSDIFFEQLSLSEPDYNLEVGSGTHSQQTAQIMLRLEAVIEKENPTVVTVFGDVNSTLAAALVCAKMHIPIAHIEAGLRSFDLAMPEEINRMVTDRLANLLFTPSKDGNRHLEKEGVDPKKIFLVGNIMIDTLIKLLSLAKEKMKRPSGKYLLVTLHRPSNVDDLSQFKLIMNTLSEIAEWIPIVFPVHPRTRAKLDEITYQVPGNLELTEPVGYIEFLGLQANATAVVTDSGGVQEETTYLQVPCLTLRENTERPVTVEVGTNYLIGKDVDKLKSMVREVLAGDYKKGEIPPLWDGHTGERIARILVEKYP